MYNWYVPSVKGITIEFISGVDHFLQYALAKVATSSNPNEVRCPCVKCNSLHNHTAEEIKLHLYRKGLTKNYYNWTCNGKEFNTLPQMSNASVDGDALRSTNRYREMVIDAVGQIFIQIHPSILLKNLPCSRLRNFMSYWEMQTRLYGKGVWPTRSCL
jgi:hypothetical protein